MVKQEEETGKTEVGPGWCGAKLFFHVKESGFYSH